MTFLINEADKVLLGNAEQDRVYLGAIHVWPPGGGSGWVDRPADWLPITLNPGQQLGQILIHVPPGATRRAEIIGEGAFQMDWGDGSPLENFASGALAAHDYPGDLLPPNETSDGMRQTIATIMPQAGQVLTALLIRDNAYDSAMAEVVNAAPTLTRFGSHDKNEYSNNILHMGSLVPLTIDTSYQFFGFGALVVATGDYTYTTAVCDDLFSYCEALQEFPLIDVSAGNSFQRMFQYTSAAQSPSFDTPNGTDFGYLFNEAYGFTGVPALETSKGINFRGMYRMCSALASVPFNNTSLGTDFRYMYWYCELLTSVPLIDTSKGTRFDGMYEGCAALTSVPAIDVARGTNFIEMFNLCPALTSIEASGFRYSVSLVGTALDAVAIDAFFTNLGIADNAAGQQTVDVTGTPGADTCDPSIAAAKGWGVIGGPDLTTPTTTVLTAPSVAVVEEGVVLTATVTADSGTVQFKMNGASIGLTGTVNASGVATATYLPSTSGTAVFTAEYQGTASWSPSASGPVEVEAFHLAGEVEWVDRPSDWLPTTIVAGEQAVQLLVHVAPGETKTVDFTANPAFTVDWGDGTPPENYAASSVTHSYVGDSLPDNATSTGARQVLVKVTPQSGNLTRFDMTSGVVTNGVVELINASPTMDLGRADIVHVGTLVPIPIPGAYQAWANCLNLVAMTGEYSLPYSCDRTFLNCPSLKVLPVMDTSAGSNFHRFLNGNASLKFIPAYDFGFGHQFPDIFDGCPLIGAVRAYGASYSIGVDNTLLDASELNIFFGNLGESHVLGATVDVTGTPGAATCDRTIAEAKGWRVMG